MGVIKDAQTIVPEPNVALSTLPLPTPGVAVPHSYTGADGKTFNYTITYPENFFTVYDYTTAPIDEDGQPIYDLMQKITIQADKNYRSAPSEDGSYREATGAQIATAIETILRGFENYWADQSLKLAYDSYGIDFNGKNIIVSFGVGQSSQVETGRIKEEYDIPIANNMEMTINAVYYALIDPNDPNGNTRVSSDTAENYLDRTIAHEFIHALMAAGGMTDLIAKSDMPQFFVEGVAELIHGDDDYDAGYLNNVRGLAQNPERLAKAMTFRPGTGEDDAYPAGDMFLRYLCKQAQPANVEIGGAGAQIFAHATSQDIISGYDSNDRINLGAGVQLGNLVAAGNDVFALSNVGTAIIRDGCDKVLNFADANGTVTGRAYFASTAGTIDGRGFSEYEFIQGANNANNEIYAGNGGSFLWGGSYSNDNLIGGAGADVFVAGVGCGSDIIFNADSNDVINLAATSLDQITEINTTNSSPEMIVGMGFIDGSVLNVFGTPGVDYNFRLADGSTYTCNSGNWSKK